MITRKLIVRSLMGEPEEMSTFATVPRTALEARTELTTHRMPVISKLYKAASVCTKEGKK